jgi:hypothetical protein
MILQHGSVYSGGAEPEGLGFSFSSSVYYKILPETYPKITVADVVGLRCVF